MSLSVASMAMFLPWSPITGKSPHMSEADSTTLSRGSVSGRAVIDRQTIHIHDLAAEAKDEFPVGVALAQSFRLSYRACHAVDSVQDVPIGAIIIRRMRGSAVH